MSQPFIEVRLDDLQNIVDNMQLLADELCKAKNWKIHAKVELVLVKIRDLYFTGGSHVESM